MGETSESGPGEVTLLCHEGHTRWGQSVFAVGEIPELGGWDPERAMALSPDDYPLWRGAVELAEPRAFEWKCIKRGDGAVEWQPGPNNRYPGSGARSSGSF